MAPHGGFGHHGRMSLAFTSSFVLVARRCALVVALAGAFAAVGCGGSVIVEDPPSTDCSSGETLCDGACADLLNDPQNCGECGHTCGGQYCISGECGSGTTVACPGSLSPCGGDCVDLGFDPQNCGGCGAVCPSGQACAAGTCVAPPCVGCAEYITADLNPDGLPLCDASASLYDALASCICAGKCIAQCTDNICTGTDPTGACQSCVGDTVNGCGLEFNDCANDI